MSAREHNLLQFFMDNFFLFPFFHSSCYESTTGATRKKYDIKETIAIENVVEQKWDMRRASASVMMMHPFCSNVIFYSHFSPTHALCVYFFLIIIEIWQARGAHEISNLHKMKKKNGKIRGQMQIWREEVSIEKSHPFFKTATHVGHGGRPIHFRVFNAIHIWLRASRMINIKTSENGPRQAKQFTKMAMIGLASWIKWH